MALTNFIDWFVPEKSKENLILRNKARLTTGVMFAFAIILFPNFIRALRIGRTDIAFMTICAALLMACCPLIMRLTQSNIVGSNMFLGIFTILLTFVTVVRGGITAYYALNYTMVVLLAFLITGLKNGIAWGVLSVAILASMRVAEVSGYQFNAVDASSAHINILVILTVLAIIGAIFEWNNANNLKRVAEERNKSEKAAEELREVLGETNSVMSSVSQGDLSKSIKKEVTGDLEVLKNSVNDALKMLGESVVKVLDTGSQINQGSNELSAASQDLAVGTSEQAASLQQIASSMDEIGGRAVTNDENATLAQQLSNEAVKNIEKGSVQMKTLLSAMETINETSRDVSKVIKVIDEIAFQTNLLALNAAVEAARAGKYGKGFSVVAEEVRNLAARSAEAAKNTTQLIEASLKEVEAGVDSANSTASTIESFVASINKVNGIVGEISESSREQSAGVTEINKGLSQVNSVVQRNSSISEQSASASEELSAQADLLQNLMGQFKLNGTVRRQSITKQPSPKFVSSSPTPVKRSVPEQKVAPSTRQIVLDDDDFGKY